MVDHLDHGRSAAGQAPGREKTPRRGPGGQPPPRRKGGQELRGILGKKTMIATPKFLLPVVAIQVNWPSRVISN